MKETPEVKIIPAGESLIGMENRRATIKAGRAILDDNGPWEIAQGAGQDVNVILRKAESLNLYKTETKKDVD